MKGDFSRETFDSVKHFSRVFQQQGRVQLDADWNEQTAIVLHYLRTLAADLIGPFAGPQGVSGFEITAPTIDDFTIGKGRYYVDGILCENEQATSYKAQKDFPNLHENREAGTEYLVYLDVWERHITALEDDYIREKALGGSDTATRTQVVWQVKIDDGKRELIDGLPTGLNPGDVRSGWGKWIALWQPPRLGCLRARVDRPEDSNDPCLTAPDAKYRGQENQLYRVEIHKGSGGGPGDKATFKWSRDNGAVVSRVVKLSGTELVVEKPLGFAAGNWVELSDDGQELRGEPGTLAKLLKVEGDRFTLESAASPLIAVPKGEDWPTKVRRWDQRKSDSLVPKDDGAVDLTEDEWLDLEDGIQIQFMKGKNRTYRTGDYWLIPARVDTGDIEWPVNLDDAGKKILKDGKVDPIPQPPFGIWHHYAPLAILKADLNLPVEDCRCVITSVLNGCGMSSSGIDGMGGPPLCGAATPMQISKASTKSEKAEASRRGKPKGV
ncbi:MAG: DUF6519 domain-containing protein [Nitrospira sp.]|nr:DUF6519 domain-containing protein [Nitrospira sp.]